MIRCPKRQIEEHDHVIQISSRRRILGLREGKFCLSQDEIDLAENDAEKFGREKVLSLKDGIFLLKHILSIFHTENLY